uniref:Uncharacterized protein n=1 Tax=Plectus sambesii TaxID=2011161 RepID=A0A914UU08_9BILA
MGSGHSALPPTPENLRSFSITFHWIRTLRVVHATPRVFTLIRKAIENNWTKGITQVINNKGAYDIEIEGRPFAHGSNGEGMLCHILEYLIADGWRLTLRSDMSRQIDFSTWFFEQSSKWKQTAKIAAVSLRGLEDLHIIHGGSAFVEAIKRALHIKYGRQGNDELFMNSCMLFLLKQLNKDGWKASGSLDVSAKHVRASDGPDFPIDVHTIFFTKK